MNQSFFISQMQRIIETFGKENFPEPRNAEIWKVVSELSDNDFRLIIDRMVGEIPIKYPPTVVNFREATEIYLKRARDKQIVQNFNEPKVIIEKTYKTSDEAIDEVSTFFVNISSGCPEWLRVGFKETAKRLFPIEFSEVERLKSMVLSGSIQSRAEYVQRAKQLMIKTATRSLLHPRPPPPNEKEGA